MNRTRLVASVAADVAVLTLLRPRPGQLRHQFAAPRQWVLRDGADQVAVTLAGLALWVVAAWVATGLLAALGTRLPGVAGHISGWIYRVAVPRAACRLIVGSTGLGLLLAPAAAAAAAPGHSTPASQGGARPAAVSAASMSRSGAGAGHSNAVAGGFRYGLPAGTVSDPPRAVPGRRHAMPQPAHALPGPTWPSGDPSPDPTSVSKPAPTGALPGPRWPGSASASHPGPPRPSATPRSSTPPSTPPSTPHSAPSTPSRPRSGDVPKQTPTPTTPGPGRHRTGSRDSPPHRTQRPSDQRPSDQRPSDQRPNPPHPLHDEVRVRPGDSIWLLAGRRLGPDATGAQIAHYWPRIYAANRDAVGPDPNIITPGQALQLPLPTAQETP